MTSSANQRSPYIGPKLAGIATKLSWSARKKMFNSLMNMAEVTTQTKVLDVGVTSDQREDCNFFEKLYPYPNNITKEENLNLLSEKDALKLIPINAKVQRKHFRLFGLISNLLFYIKN